MSKPELVLTSTDDSTIGRCYSFTYDKAVGIEEGRSLIHTVIATHKAPVKILFNKQPPYLAQIAYFDDEIHYYKLNAQQNLRQVLLEDYFTN